MPHLLTVSSETPSTLLSVSFPSEFSTRSTAAPLEPVVQRIKVESSVAGESQPKWGRVDRIGSSLGVLELDAPMVALAHSTDHISLIQLNQLNDTPSSPTSGDDDDEEDSVLPQPSCSIVKTYKSSAIKQGNRHISLDFLPSSHLLHATSGGRLSLHSLPSSLDDAATTTMSKIRLPANLTTLRPSADGKTFAYAGKEVDVSLWDLERALAAPPSAADADATASKKRKAGKAKENEKLLPGEIWRAKNIANNFLSLRPEVHHTALTFLHPSSPALIASGTSSGHVRLYDPRSSARKPVSNWSVAPSAITSLTSGSSRQELYFGERDSGKIGCLDGRTGRVLYAFGENTSTATSLLAANADEKDRRLLMSVGKDATLTVMRTTEIDEDPKKTPLKGGVAARIGGVQGGVVRAWPGEPATAEVVGTNEEEDDEEVWEGMGEVGGDGRLRDEADDDDEDDQEDGLMVTIQDEADEESDQDDEGDSDKEERPPVKSTANGQPARKGGKKMRI